VSWRDVNGEIVALDLESSSYFTTNRSGSLMWHQLVGGATSDQLADLLRSTYAISLEECRRDVDAFIEVLREHNLLADQD
jgi:hypothetical protein